MVWYIRLLYVLVVASWIYVSQELCAVVVCVCVWQVVSGDFVASERLIESAVEGNVAKFNCFCVCMFKHDGTIYAVRVVSIDSAV